MTHEIGINLCRVAVAAAFFIGFWLVNAAFGIWKNVGVLKKRFELEKVKTGIAQTLVLALGLALFCILITAYPRFLMACGLEIPEEYVDLFSTAAILMLFLYPTLLYVKDAYKKLTVILGGKEKA